MNAFQPLGDGIYRVGGAHRSAITGRYIQGGTMTSSVEALRNDLQRRRELKAMTKPELISYVIDVENSLQTLTERIEADGTGR